mgnify:CR=1 FL=1
MIGLGTIVNCIAIAAGSSLGVFLKGGLPRRFETTIMQRSACVRFFIGIGGAGMSAIAALMLQAGVTVSGSDRAESSAVESLRAAGAT